MRIWLPVATLVTLVLLLGHDAMMATDPHGQASAREHHHVMEQEASSCLAIEGARVDRPDLPAPDGAAADFPIVLASVPGQPPSDIAWREAPGHPPDVRRALLQVFLN